MPSITPSFPMPNGYGRPAVAAQAKNNLHFGNTENLDFFNAGAGPRNGAKAPAQAGVAKQLPPATIPFLVESPPSTFPLPLLRGQLVVFLRAFGEDASVFQSKDPQRFGKTSMAIQDIIQTLQYLDWDNNRQERISLIGALGEFTTIAAHMELDERFQEKGHLQNLLEIMSRLAAIKTFDPASEAPGTPE